MFSEKDTMVGLGHQGDKLHKAMQNIGFVWIVAALAREIFFALLITLLLLLLVETIWNKSVSTYFNLDFIFIIVVVVGLLTLLHRPGVERRKGELRFGGVYLATAVCASLAGSAIIWYEIQEIGWASYLISVILGGASTLLPLLTARGRR